MRKQRNNLPSCWQKYAKSLRRIERSWLTKRRLTDDSLILAAGSSHSYFGHDDWENLGRDSNRSTTPRRSDGGFFGFRGCRAPTLPHRIERLLTFVIVGGGPTGVELAGAIAEIAQHTLRQDFRHINPAQTRALFGRSAPARTAYVS